MSDVKEALQSLQDGIADYIDNKISTSEFDKTLMGTVKSVNSDGSYNIMINGTLYEYVDRSNVACRSNDTVLVLVPQNNYDNMVIIQDITESFENNGFLGDYITLGTRYGNIGMYSITAGYDNEASSQSGVSIGIGNRNKGLSSMTVGQENKIDSEDCFSVGKQNIIMDSDGSITSGNFNIVGYEQDYVMSSEDKRKVAQYGLQTEYRDGIYYQGSEGGGAFGWNNGLVSAPTFPMYVFGSDNTVGMLYPQKQYFTDDDGNPWIDPETGERGFIIIPARSNDALMTVLGQSNVVEGQNGIVVGQRNYTLQFDNEYIHYGSLTGGQDNQTNGGNCNILYGEYLLNKGGTTNSIFGYKNINIGSNNAVSGENNFTTGQHNTVIGYSNAIGTNNKNLYGINLYNDLTELTKDDLTAVNAQDLPNSFKYKDLSELTPTTSPYYCSAEGTENVISQGEAVHIEGQGNVSMGNYHHIEGQSNTMSAVSCNHIEGYQNLMGGNFSYSHAEGSNNQIVQMGMTPPSSSHIEGIGNICGGEAQHVQGKYNVPNVNYAHIVGGGTSASDRKNIHTLDYNGNSWNSGDITCTTSDTDPTVISLRAVASASISPEVVDIDFSHYFI